MEEPALLEEEFSMQSRVLLLPLLFEICHFLFVLRFRSSIAGDRSFMAGVDLLWEEEVFLVLSGVFARSEVWSRCDLQRLFGRNIDLSFRWSGLLIEHAASLERALSLRFRMQPLVLLLQIYCLVLLLQLRYDL